MRLIAATLGVLIIPATVGAHHSTTAFYDRTTTVEIEGVVTAASWRNPHVALTLLVEDEHGVAQEWELEGGAMNSLRRRGFTGESVKIGDRVRVAGGPALGGRRGIFVTNFLLPDNQEILFTDRSTPLLWTEEQESSADSTFADSGAQTHTSIFRVWKEEDSYRLRAPLSLTPVAQAAKDSWNPVTDDPSLRCEAPSLPNAILNPYPIEFIDEGDQIRLKIEEWDSVRIIHLSADALPRDVGSSRLGYSRGRWEGRTLIVETSRLNGPYLDDSGVPQSEEAEIVERFSLSADASRLDYEVTITDPVNLMEPAVWETEWLWEPGGVVRPFECTLR